MLLYGKTSFFIGIPTSSQHHPHHRSWSNFVLFLSVLIISTTASTSVEPAENNVLAITTDLFQVNNVTNLVKLNVCEKKNNGTTWQGFMQLPTFSVETKKYTLQSQKLQADDSYVFNCRSGEKPLPINSTNSSTISIRKLSESLKGHHDEISILSLLRSANVLFDNGYMAVAENGVVIYYPPTEYCIDSISGQEDDTEINFKICPISKERSIIMPKCCPLGMFLVESECVAFPKGEKWSPQYLDVTTKALLSFDKVQEAGFFLWSSPRLKCGQMNDTETWIADGCSLEFYPVTDNSVAFIGAFRKWEYIPSNVSKCLELFVTEDKPPTTILIHCTGKGTKKSGEKNLAPISMLYMMNMYIGAFFHMLTTLVYLITWSKQNIHGKTLCSCTASLFFMQIFLGTAHLLGQYKSLRRRWFCIGNSIGGQYFMISTYTWLLVVNIDLWRTFRSIRAENSKSRKRFLLFSSLGWGFPLVITAVSVALDFTFTCRASGVPVPEYGEHYCFVAPWAQGYYVYYILSILIGLTCIFAALTLFGLYTFKKDSGSIRSSKRADDKQNVLLYLKLGVVMGLTWVFEVISWAAQDDTDNHIGWIVIDFYNSLSAILIFIIFVCKRTTLNLLEQTVPIFKGVTAAVAKITRETSLDNTASTALGSSANNFAAAGGGIALKVQNSKNGQGSCDNFAYE